MRDLTDERLTELEALAKAATKGDWHEEDDCRHGLANACGAFRNYDVNVHFACGPRVSTVEQAEADSRYIIAAQPKVVLSLIAEVRRLRADLAAAQTAAAATQYEGKVCPTRGDRPTCRAIDRMRKALAETEEVTP